MDKFQLNEMKCKELLINFSTKNTTSFYSVVVNGMPIELVASAKTVGLNVSTDLKWNSHIDSVIKTAKKRLYSLSQLKRSGLGTRELVQSFCTCIRPITEYACRFFHDSLPAYLSNELEGVQKRTMRIIFPFCSYNESLVELSLLKLPDCRQELVDKLFKEVVQNKENMLHCLLPALNPRSNLRNTRKFRPVFKRNRFRNSFVTSNTLKLCSRSIVLEVSIAFYHVDFVYFIFYFFNKSQFYCNVFMSCSRYSFLSFIFID